MPEYTTGRATPIENRNFLAPTGFKFTLERAKSVSFFCNQANVPEIAMPVTEVPTRFRSVPIIPGGGVTFGDFNVQFIIDEDLPKLPYLTFMDCFILLSYFYTGTATILCVYSFLRKLKSGRDLSVVDSYAQFIGPISYFGIFSIVTL